MFFRSLPNTDTVGNTRKPSFGIGSPVENHRLLIGSHKDSTVRQICHDGEVVAVERICQKFTGDFNAVESCYESWHQLSAEMPEEFRYHLYS